MPDLSIPLPDAATEIDRRRIPGWYGKLPGIGDFATRRLPPGFVLPWDQWLQRALAASQAELGDAWLDTYLSSPIWRFALSAGVCGPDAWCGILVPSVDRVGRYFPLTIAVAVDPLTPFDFLVAQADWFDAVEQVALDCLRVTVRPDDVESGLEGQPLPAGAVSRARLDATQIAALARADGDLLDLSPQSDLGAMVAAATQMALAQDLSPRTLWWTTAGGAAPITVVGARGLPESARFA
ncbi:MAG TPA: type VI secretion system-associated protein TagF, partial [Burkholderiaceae bacterium]|nr:type VI secretion system-associated protein TagF [Burkholderiaceae bacterium]